MSPKGRPKGEYRSAKREGRVRSARARTRGRPKGEYRSAQREGSPVSLRANQIAGLASAIAEIRTLQHPADSLLHDFFRRHKAMGQHDRAFIADGVFAYFRRRRSLEALAQTERPMRLALAVLVRELGIGMREWDGVIGADDALWLREFKARLATKPSRRGRRGPAGLALGAARCAPMAMPSAPRSPTRGSRPLRSICASIR